MQIGSLNTANEVAANKLRGGDAVNRSTPLARTTADAQAEPAASARPSASLRRGLKLWDQQLNREVADAQQAMQFLDASSGQLEALKADISARIAGRQVSDEQIDSKLQQFAHSWRQRRAASGGSIDAQLKFSSPAPASQRFTIRGLNLQTLQAGDKETLSFALGMGQALQSVIVEPGLPDEEIAQRFDRALAPARIRVSQGKGGALVFSVPESAWIATRDSIAIKGDGVRFPTGQFSRVKAEAEPPAVDPASWQTHDVQALRVSLQRVIQALERVRQTRETVSRALAQATQRADQARSSDDAATAARLAQDFSALSQQPEYRIFSTTVAALLGISRERVLSLLALGER